jgi:hypothetical protein
LCIWFLIFLFRFIIKGNWKIKKKSPNYTSAINLSPCLFFYWKIIVLFMFLLLWIKSTKITTFW